MALVDTTWYANSVAYAAVTQFAISTAYTAGQLVRQLATPTVGNERVFICIVAGTSAGSEPSWTLTRGAKTVSNTATFQECTGQAALNGDLADTTTWAAVKAATPAVLGQIIKRSSGASYQICTTAGAMSASEPAFSDTAGVTTTDTTAVWTSLGAVGSYTGGMAPFARLASVFGTNWFVAGNTAYVGGNHAESQTTALSISPVISGTSLAVGRILCHDQSGSYPPTSSDLRTTATISTTAAANITFGSTGQLYVYGLTFKAGVGQSATSSVTISPGVASWLYLDNCSLQVATTNIGSQVIIGANYNHLFFNNVTLSFANTSQNIRIGNSASIALLLWQSTAPLLAAGSVVPTTLFKSEVNNQIHNIVLEAIDLSQITGELFNFGSPSSLINATTVTVRDCKLNASATVAMSSTGWGQLLQFSRSSA